MYNNFHVNNKFTKNIQGVNRIYCFLLSENISSEILKNKINYWKYNNIKKKLHNLLKYTNINYKIKPIKYSTLR